MDNMQQWELYDLYINLQYADAPNWEMTRWIMFAICQVNCRKKLSPTDLIEFPWDIDYKEHKTSISDKDIDRLKAMSVKLSKYMKENE